MKLAPVKYRIATAAGPREVSGYAVELPGRLRGIRVCVRRVGGEWCADHYDSGMSMGGPVMAVTETDPGVIARVRRWRFDGGSRARAARWITRYLAHLRRCGALRAHFETHGLGWCLDEAGL